MPEEEEKSRQFKRSGRSLLRYNGEGGVVEIPKGILEIRKDAFRGREDQITEMIFPDDSTRTIRFSGWKNLRRIRFSDSMKELPNGVCCDCPSLEEVHLPASLKEVPKDAFRGCLRLKSIAVPDSAAVISDRAFSGCRSLQEVFLGDNTGEIGESAFDGCISLQTVRFPEKLWHISNWAFVNCRSLREVVFQSPRLQIWYGAFCWCRSLERVVLPDSMRVLHDSVFRGCSSLKELRLPSELEIMERNCLAETGLERLELPEGFHTLAKGALDSSKLRVLSLPASLRELSMSAFRNTPPVHILWMADNTGDPEGARLVPYSRPDLPEFVIDAPYFRFRGTPASVMTALCRGFAERDLQGGEIAPEVRADYLSYLRRKRKDLCREESLFRIVLRKGMIPAEEIGEFLETAAELDNPAVTAALLEYRNTHFSQEALDQAEKKKVARELKKVASGTVSVGELRKIWSWESSPEGGIVITSWKGAMEKELVVPSEIAGKPVRGIGEKAFSPEVPRLRTEQKTARRDLERVVLPDTLKYIGERAFQGCSGLKRVSLPGSLGVIGKYAFTACVQLQEITVPGGVEALSEGAFSDCAALSRAVLEEGVRKAENSCFRGCGSLRYILLPASLKSMSATALAGCRDLTAECRGKITATVGRALDAAGAERKQ